MGRPLFLLFVSLAAALAGFGVLADRALVRETLASAELSSARAGQDGRTAALSVRGALGQIEQDVLAGRSPAGIRQQTLALPPELSASLVRPYGDRPRSELVKLLLSTEATPSGLPEAVVAFVALKTPASRQEVSERLLTGRLPVRPEDLPSLASMLGVSGDPRVADLKRWLQDAPDPSGLPQMPAFRRRLIGAGTIEGWTRRGRASLRYEVPLQALLERAGVADRAEVENPSDQSSGASNAVVPDVDGLRLRITSPPFPKSRLLAARSLLWSAVAACLVALGLIRRALAREAHAVAREKAFVANVTHELRTPVASIRVLGEALVDGAGDPREYGGLLVEESQRLETLVEKTLASARMDEAPLRFAPVRPGELLNSAVALMQPTAERRGVTLNVNADGELGDAYWDGDAVRRALVNLIENAIKHGGSNGKIEAAARGDGVYVLLSVQDNGPGIGRRDHKRLFGRFERGTEEVPGVGLGLYLVDQVARAHGGRVDLTEDAGCKFTLKLPRLPPAATQAALPKPTA